jgi:hypothetical protein
MWANFARGDSPWDYSIPNPRLIPGIVTVRQERFDFRVNQLRSQAIPHTVAGGFGITSVD